MQYDIIGDARREEVSFFTIRDLIDVAKKYPEKIFKFLGTEYTIGDLYSWSRGLYQADVSYKNGSLKGCNISESMVEQLKRTYVNEDGYLFHYDDSDEFYVSQYGSCEEYKVVGYRVDGATIVLLTKLDPY